MRFGMVTTRIEGSLMSYTWKLVPQQGGKWPATAASDSIKLISLAVGFSY
jgi:hypothetical protein